MRVCTHYCINSCDPHHVKSQPWWLSGLRRILVHSLMIARHCVLRNWDRILVRAVKGLISRAGIVSICPLLWQRDVKTPKQSTCQEFKQNGRLCDVVLLIKAYFANFVEILDDEHDEYYLQSTWRWPQMYTVYVWLIKRFIFRKEIRHIWEFIQIVSHLGRV